MPFEYQISTDENLVTIHVFGRLSDEDVLGALEALRTDPNYRRDMHRLWDWQEVKEHVFELNQMPEIDAAVSAVSRSGRTAFVVTREVGEIVAQYFRLYVKWRPIKVFWSIEEARVWLLSA